MVELLFTTSTPWTVPKDWTNQNIFEVYAGGGGATNPYVNISGQQLAGLTTGFAGGYSFRYNVDWLKPGDSVEIIVGRRGVGGVGTGLMKTTIIDNGSSRFNFFENFNFVGTAGTNSSVFKNTSVGNDNIVNATGGGPGVVAYPTFPSGFRLYPGANQLGAPLRLYGLNSIFREVDRYTPYPPISDGLLVKNLAFDFGRGGGGISQAGRPGVVAISYISRTTHSPCVWIS